VLDKERSLSFPRKLLLGNRVNKVSREHEKGRGC